MFYERVLFELSQKNLTKSKMLSDIGLSHNLFNKWKDPNCLPNGATLSKIASYFDVSIDYLLGRTDDPSPKPITIPDILKNVPIAFHRGEFEGLTQDEIDSLAKIAMGYKAIRNQS